jgi:protein phosphatase 1 regulatory subunit 11
MSYVVCTLEVGSGAVETNNNSQSVPVFYSKRYHHNTCRQVRNVNRLNLIEVVASLPVQAYFIRFFIMDDSRGTHSETNDNNSGSRNVFNDVGGGYRAGGRGGATINASAAATTTIVDQQGTEDEFPVLLLTLRPRSNVTWEGGVVNNEGMGRKSSKRCCIFHKQRAFGESSTESSEDHSGDDHSTSSSSSGGGGSGAARLPLARKKEGKKKRGGISNKPKVPDYQRNHA